ncbi:MAG: hypothetical protein HN732_14155 [Rhodospirillaceae bacterium]|nr:hypothetical protein [Rhodospirillaceae bacterium]
MTMLQWTIENWNEDVDVQLISQKNGEGTQSFIGGIPSLPGGSLPVSGLDERVFFSGVGTYILTLTILGNVSTRTSRTLELTLLEPNGSILVRESATITPNLAPINRRQLSRTTTLGISNSNFFEGSKNQLRFCKGVRLTTIGLVEAGYAVSANDFNANLFDLGPEDDPAALQPEEVEIIIQQGGVDIDQFTYRRDGTIRQLPILVDLDQPVGLLGTRTSGAAPFFPDSTVQWTLLLTLECTGS